MSSAALNKAFSEADSFANSSAKACEPAEARSSRRAVTSLAAIAHSYMPSQCL
jgi:hypothetical protein